MGSNLFGLSLHCLHCLKCRSASCMQLFWAWICYTLGWQCVFSCRYEIWYQLIYKIDYLANIFVLQMLCCYVRWKCEVLHNKPIWYSGVLREPCRHGWRSLRKPRWIFRQWQHFCGPSSTLPVATPVIWCFLSSTKQQLELGRKVFCPHHSSGFDLPRKWRMTDNISNNKNC